MHSPFQTRRQSLRPVLALPGVAGTALTLALAPRATAIGGGLANGNLTGFRIAGGIPVLKGNRPAVSLEPCEKTRFRGGVNVARTF